LFTCTTRPVFYLFSGVGWIIACLLFINFDMGVTMSVVAEHTVLGERGLQM
jgi:hypothetical protein